MIDKSLLFTIGYCFLLQLISLGIIAQGSYTVESLRKLTQKVVEVIGNRIKVLRADTPALEEASRFSHWRLFHWLTLGTFFAWIVLYGSFSITRRLEIPRYRKCHE
jgi:hypothetical protein